jgi:hypothetical protein
MAVAAVIPAAADTSMVEVTSVVAVMAAAIYAAAAVNAGINEHAQRKNGSGVPGPFPQDFRLAVAHIIPP